MVSAYEEVYRDILRSFNGKRLLTIADVSRYTGIKDYRSIRKHFPFGAKNVIGIVPFARVMAGEEN